MATTDTADAGRVAHADGISTHIFLQPIAAPAVLGYFAGATGFLLFGVWFAGALGGAKNAVTLFPFLLSFAGFGHVAAGLWSVKTRGCRCRSRPWAHLSFAARLLNAVTAHASTIASEIANAHACQASSPNAPASPPQA